MSSASKLPSMTIPKVTHALVENALVGLEANLGSSGNSPGRGGGSSCTVVAPEVGAVDVGDL